MTTTADQLQALEAKRVIDALMVQRDDLLRQRDALLAMLRECSYHLQHDRSAHDLRTRARALLEQAEAGK